MTKQELTSLFQRDRELEEFIELCCVLGTVLGTITEHLIWWVSWGSPASGDTNCALHSSKQGFLVPEHISCGRAQLFAYRTHFLLFVLHTEEDHIFQTPLQLGVMESMCSLSGLYCKRPMTGNPLSFHVLWLASKPRTALEPPWWQRLSLLVSLSDHLERGLTLNPYSWL